MLDLGRIKAFVESLPETGIPAVECRVWRDHEELLYAAAGFRDAEKKVPASPADYYWFYSLTKPTVAATAAALIERGMLSPEDPVEKYLPEWGRVLVKDGDALRRPKRAMTVGHLLSMQGGLDYSLENDEIRAARAKYGRKLTTGQVAEALSKRPLCFDPGDHFQYSLCLDVVGAVIEAASGKRMSECAAELIFGPCGADTATFHPTAEQRKHQSTQYMWDEKSSRAVPMSQENEMLLESDLFESGGAGLFGRSEDYIRFADAMACGGVSCTGKRILKPETIARMTENTLDRTKTEDFYQMEDWLSLERGYGYGWGVRSWQLGKRNGVECRNFGWDGAASSYVLMDPAQRISAVLTMHVRSCQHAYRNGHGGVRRLLYEALAAEA